MSNKTEIMLGPSAAKEGIHMIARYEDDKVEILLIESDKARFLSIPTIERYTSRISELEAENEKNIKWANDAETRAVAAEERIAKLEARVKELEDANRDMIESYIDSVKELNGRIAELETENKLLRGALIDAKIDAAALVDQERWIPVTERLPETSMWVLCICSEERHWLAFRALNGWYIDTSFGQKFVGDQDATKHIKIQHWQPLTFPQPPKEQ